MHEIALTIRNLIITTVCGASLSMATAAELEEFYTSEYRQVYQGDEGPTQKDFFVQNGRAKTLLAFMDAKNVQSRRYLDIGSSSGILMKRVQEHYGCQVLGVEPGEAYREYAAKQGLKVYADIADLKSSAEGEFDVVSMAHVLEHMPDPVRYLADLRDGIAGGVRGLDSCFSKEHLGF